MRERAGAAAAGIAASSGRGAGATKAGRSTGLISQLQTRATRNRLAMITSAANRGWTGDVLISDLPKAGLPVPSIVRTAKLATIEARDAQRLGTLPPADRNAVSRALRDRLAAALDPV